MQIISNLLIALFLTITIEIVVSLCLGFKKKSEILTLIFLNIITNPLLNYLLMVNSYFYYAITKLPLIIFLELVVVLVEWKILLYVLREKPLKLFILSLLMNLCSFSFGLII